MTVKLRLTLAALLLFLITFGIAGVFVLTAHREAAHDALEMSLQTRLDDLITVDQQASGSEGLSNSHGRDSLAMILSPDGTVRITTDQFGDATEILALVEPGTDPTTVALTTFRETQGTERFHVLVAEDERGHVAIVGQSLRSVDASVDDLQQSLLIVGPLLALAATLVTAFVANSALAPVGAIGRQAAEIGIGDLDRRVPTSGRADELGDLAAVLNDMLSRLERSTNTQQQLVANMAHELRSPLTAIATQLDVDLTHPDNADWPTTASDALDETHRLQTLIDNLLLLARLDNDAEQVATDLVDLDEIVHNTIDRLVDSELVIDRSGVGAGVVRGDAGQLQRCIQNLLDNAVRYADTRVSVSLNEHGSFVVLTIVDDGPGMDEEEHDRIFERFYRVHSARDRDSGGSGLGLAIVRELVTANGGTVEASRSDSTGTTMTVRLPADLV